MIIFNLGGMIVGVVTVSIVALTKTYFPSLLNKVGIIKSFY